MKYECEMHPDPAHDFSHVQRVVKSAQDLALKEGADLNVVIPAAYLHDVVIISKSDPRRTQASQLSADEAIQFLRSLNYPEKYFKGIHHAITAHSFSAGIQAETLEAKIVQDADRLDGLGAVGIARCFALSGVFKTKFYNDEQMISVTRPLNDKEYTLDHFFVKLLKVPEMLHTKSARAEGQRRAEYLKGFVAQLQTEV
ncbi:MAG: HD domain-containing protein [Bdellovibrio sp.]|nr:HD domain-containing protein [Bdellovibrio sp.]